MTDQRKDEMPEVWISWKETIKQKNTDNFNVHLWPCVFDHKRDYAVKYIRADLSPPLPDDVAEAIKLIRNATACNRGCGLEYYADEIGIIIRAASTPSVDTIAVSREVLQGVREALDVMLNRYQIMMDKFNHGELYYREDVWRARKALASLNAVLSEGEP